MKHKEGKKGENGKKMLRDGEYITWGSIILGNLSKTKRGRKNDLSKIKCEKTRANYELASM